MILVAIGANLPGLDGASPVETCRKAVTKISAVPNLCLIASSSWWKSAPMPPSGQPTYINGVVRFEGNIDPATLLRHLQAIETQFGRTRTGPNTARTLDLDIIAMGSIVRDTPDPILPHPRAHLRSFVLAPLLEIAPNWTHPVLLRPATSLLAELSDQACEPLPVGNDDQII